MIERSDSEVSVIKYHDWVKQIKAYSRDQMLEVYTQCLQEDHGIELTQEHVSSFIESIVFDVLYDSVAESSSSRFSLTPLTENEQKRLQLLQQITTSALTLPIPQDIERLSYHMSSLINISHIHHHLLDTNGVKKDMYEGLIMAVKPLYSACITSKEFLVMERLFSSVESMPDQLAWPLLNEMITPGISPYAPFCLSLTVQAAIDTYFANTGEFQNRSQDEMKQFLNRLIDVLPEYSQQGFDISIANIVSVPWLRSKDFSSFHEVNSLLNRASTYKKDPSEAVVPSSVFYSWIDRVETSDETILTPAELKALRRVLLQKKSNDLYQEDVDVVRSLLQDLKNTEILTDLVSTFMEDPSRWRFQLALLFCLIPYNSPLLQIMNEQATEREFRLQYKKEGWELCPTSEPLLLKSLINDEFIVVNGQMVMKMRGKPAMLCVKGVDVLSSSVSTALQDGVWYGLDDKNQRELVYQAYDAGETQVVIESPTYVVLRSMVEEEEIHLKPEELLQFTKRRIKESNEKRSIDGTSLRLVKRKKSFEPFGF